MSGREIFPKDFRLAKINDHYNSLKKEHDALMDYFSKTPDLQKKREILRRQRQIIDTQTLFVLTKVELTELKDALKKLPSREQFNAVKSQVIKSEERVRGTFDPIKKLYDEYTQNMKRMEKYGYFR